MTKIGKTGFCLLIAWGIIAAHGCGDDPNTGGIFNAGGEVSTDRDDRGVWFITGPDNASLYDISEAMGYAVATDRLWQLEQYRRTGRGRLSEILGPSMLRTDSYLRTVGYSEEELLALFDALGPEPRAMVQGYVDGINRRVSEVLEDPLLLPLEFKAIDFQRLLQFDFTPTLSEWTVVDLLSWIIVLQRNFDGQALKLWEIRNADLYQVLAEGFPDDHAQMFEDLRWLNDPDAQTYIPDGAGKTKALAGLSGRIPSGAGDRALPNMRQAAASMTETRDTVVNSLKSINAWVKMGSYGWVVSGAKTWSGNPILYSGPQMGFDVPSIVTEGSIRAGGLNVSGMTVPGMPTLIVSRTPIHALAMMTGHAKTEDYYIEEPSDVFLHRTEIIPVLGQPDETVGIYRSAHGPVMSPMPYDPASYDPEADGSIISWKYAHWGRELEFIVAALKVLRARDLDEAGEGAEILPSSFHVLYANRGGEIAYWMTGRDPVRPPGEWRLPQGFLGPHLEWDADILKARSTDRNTSQGFYCGWNNKSSADTDAPYGPFHRAHVIHDFLSARNDLTYEDVRGLALNIATTDSFGSGGNPWKFVEAYFTNVVNANATPARTGALSILSGWDGHFVDGGEASWARGTDRADAWVLMDAWIREVIRLTFEDELGSDLDNYTLFNVLLHGLPGTTLNNRYDWFRNLSDGTAPQTADAIILVALDNALVALEARPWGTDARGEIAYEHPVLEQFGNGIVHTMPRSSRSTYAQCIEYGPDGPVRIESMFPLGESGNILTGPLFIFTPVYDPNFFSMTEVYDGFEHRPFPLFE